MKKHKIAACGIDCNECGHYKLAMKQDLKSMEYLIEYFRDGGWIEKYDGAEAVLKKVPLCKGCWDKSNVQTPYCAGCFLRACCEEKQLNHCGECESFPCDKYNKWIGNLEHHQNAMEYLLSLK